MAITKRDSLIIEVSQLDNGYFLRYWRWDSSPPPVPHRDLTGTNAVDQIDMKANDKGDLVQLMSQLLEGKLGGAQ